MQNADSIALWCKMQLAEPRTIDLLAWLLCVSFDTIHLQSLLLPCDALSIEAAWVNPKTNRRLAVTPLRAVRFRA